MSQIKQAVKAAARRVLPERMRALRHERSELRQVPRMRVAEVHPRSDLDLPEVFRSLDPELWQRVESRIAECGLTHNRRGVNPGDRRALAAFAAYLEPQNVLEVGTHIGSSTLTLAATLAGSGARITTVDIEDVNDPAARLWEQYGAEMSPADLVRGQAPVTFVTDTSIRFLKRTDQEFDLIFLDGAHRAAVVYEELPLALARLARGGLILMHDYFPDGRPIWPDGELIYGPYLAVRRLVAEGAPIRVEPVGELPWPTKLGSNATSLAVVLGHEATAR